MGVGSRSDIRKQAKQGLITVNGAVVKDSGFHVDPYHDKIVVGGELVTYREFIYLMMNKPPGVLSATEDKRDRTVLDLLKQEYVQFEPFPVGRLDKDTVGSLRSPMMESLLTSYYRHASMSLRRMKLQLRET